MSNIIVIVGTTKEIKEKRHQIIQETSLYGKGYSFRFISIDKDDYFGSLQKLKKLLNENREDCKHLYVVQGYTSGKDFARKIKATLNKRYKKLLSVLQGLESYLLDMKNHKIVSLYPPHIPDKNYHYLNGKKIA